MYNVNKKLSLLSILFSWIRFSEEPLKVVHSERPTTKSRYTMYITLIYIYFRFLFFSPTLFPHLHYTTYYRMLSIKCLLWEYKVQLCCKSEAVSRFLYTYGYWIFNNSDCKNWWHTKWRFTGEFSWGSFLHLALLQTEKNYIYLLLILQYPWQNLSNYRISPGAVMKKYPPRW